MMPKLNPKQLQKAMQRMGIQQKEIDAVEVIIRTKKKEIIINNPEVSLVNMMGQESFQITGDIEERELKNYNDDDIKTVMDQTNCSKKEAIDALEKSKGDLAEAILSLKSQ